MDKLKQWLTWQWVALLLGGGALFTLIAIFAPANVQNWLLGGNGLLMTFVAYHLPSPLGKGSSDAQPSSPSAPPTN